MNSSVGGLGYHLRAARYRNDLWRSYRSHIGLWLMQWEQRHHEVLLVGPSAGYSLSKLFLSRYHTIWVCEVDILGRILLRKRFPQHNIQFVKDLSVVLSYAHNIDILFCNVLGQLTLKGQSPQDLIKLLPKKSYFASYHDLFSFEGRFNWIQESIEVAGAVDETKLLSQFLKPESHHEIRLEDHRTQNIFPASKRQIIHWEIIPNRHHLIECVSSNSF